MGQFTPAPTSPVTPAPTVPINGPWGSVNMIAPDLNCVFDHEVYKKSMTPSTLKFVENPEHLACPDASYEEQFNFLDLGNVCVKKKTGTPGCDFMGSDLNPFCWDWTAQAQAPSNIQLPHCESDEKQIGPLCFDKCKENFFENIIDPTECVRKRRCNAFSIAKRARAFVNQFRVVYAPAIVKFNECLFDFFAQPQNYLRPNFEHLRLSYIMTDCVNPFVDVLDFESLITASRRRLGEVDAYGGNDKHYYNYFTITFEASWHIVFGASIEFGLVFTRKKNTIHTNVVNIMDYELTHAFRGSCFGGLTDAEAGASVNFGFWKNKEDIEGWSWEFSFGGDLGAAPFAPGPGGSMDFWTVQAYNAPMTGDAEVYGFGFGGGAGVGVSCVEAGVHRCQGHSLVEI